jgi:hypothetical protein
MTAWTPERLRRAALDRLGPHADARVRDALSQGELSIEASVAQWESSAGRTRAHRVLLFVDAGTLGSLRRAPAIRDALVAVLSATLAIEPLESLHELALRWRSAPGGLAAYRDAPAPPTRADTLREALAAYVEAAGEGGLGGAVRRATLDVGDGQSSAPAQCREVRIELPSADSLAHGDARSVLTLSRAVRDLLANDRTRVRVHARGRAR